MPTSRNRPSARRQGSPRSRSGGDKLGLVIIGLAALLGLAVVAGLVVAIVPSGDETASLRGAGGVGECDNAHVDRETGTAAGLACDNRVGAPLPGIEQGDPRLAARSAGCRLQTDLESEGDAHVPATVPVPYLTDPPTSGPMYEATIADGAYLTTPPAPYVVHSLEHGRVAMQYDPALEESAQLQLKAILDESPTQVLLFPNRRMKPVVAAAAWTRLLACDEFEPAALDALRTFRDVYRNQGPETASGAPR
jgi:hypothetical protein